MRAIHLECYTSDSPDEKSSLVVTIPAQTGRVWVLRYGAVKKEKIRVPGEISTASLLSLQHPLCILTSSGGRMFTFIVKAVSCERLLH